MFSTMTTEPSTMSPKSMAPRLMRLPDRPSAFMPMNAASIESGMAVATSSPPRTLPSIKSKTTMTRMPPSMRFLATVLIVRFTRSVRS
jgi:hypothetical protein